MRLLLATKDSSINPYISQLREGLVHSDRTTVVSSGLDAFWNGPLDADVVHIHWPDALFNWKEPDEAGLRRLANRLHTWRSRARIVVTIHDRFPHYSQTTIYGRLFDLVYSESQGFIHLGRTSVQEFNDIYPVLREFPVAIIPIGTVDAFFPNDVSSEDARGWLGIPQTAYAGLSFGYLRDYEETRLLMTAFRALGMPDKFFVIAGKSIALSQYRPVRVARRLRIEKNRRVLLHQGRVPDEEVQYYVNAANVVLIPRVQILNSSNVTLGYSFGKVVVGPDDGNVGEILRETGNPVYTPGDATSMAAAIELARFLEASGKGGQNLQHAYTEWNWPLIIDSHLEFYERILGSPLTGDGYPLGGGHGPLD